MNLFSFSKTWAVQATYLKYTINENSKNLGIFRGIFQITIDATGTESLVVPIITMTA